MRTPAILIATLLFAATAATAAPRSLSTGEPQSVDLPPSKVQILEAPKPEFTPAAPAAAQAEPARTAPAVQPETRAVETAPAEVKPTVAQPAQTPPAETKAVETKPAETVSSTDTTPVKQVQRKSRQRQVSVEQRMHREFRNIERIVIPAIGFAIAGSSFYW